MMICIPEPGDKCDYKGCVKPATHIAVGRSYGTDPGHPNCGVYCETHAYVVAEEGNPEYAEQCPNCGCNFGVN